MTWAVVILLALAAFAVAVLVFRLPRATWASFAAALVFGLAGYTLQASPDVPAAPKALAQQDYNDDWQVVDSRKMLVGSALRSTSDTMLTADAFARRGQFEVAAGFLGGVVQEHPQDFEAWVALGNALTEQADGMLTQASLYAFRQASRIAPENPAPAYFLGLSLIRQGRMMEARQAWRSALSQTVEEDSEAHEFMADRVERLEALLSQSGAIPQEGAE
jgi:cytochrome c-type biogenesis protein CcmH